MDACKSTGSEQQRALLQMDSKLKSKHTSQFKNNPIESQYLGEDLNSAVAGDTLITNWKSRAVVSSATRAFNESVRNARKLWKSVDLHSIDSDSNLTDYEELDYEPMAVPKVAFLFMVLNHMENEDIWDSFFESAGAGKFSIYVHRAWKTAPATPFSRWGAIMVPHVPSAWCALSGVEVAIFKHALADKANAQFVLLSHDAVPLKPFDYIYTDLAIKSLDRSKICYDSHAGPGGNLQNGQLWHPMHPLILKHHQWVVLSRSNTRAFVGNAQRAIEEVDAAIGWLHYGCSDEGIVSAALLLAVDPRRNSASVENTDEDVKNAGVDQSCLTWVYWKGALQGTPLDLSGVVEAPKDWDWMGHPLSFGPHGPGMNANYLRKLVTQEGFMFGRKFSTACFVDDGSKLSDSLPSLWKDVNTELAPSRVWSRLDSSGMPSDGQA